MRRENKRVIVSLALTGCMVFTTEFGSIAAETQSEAQAIRTIHHETKIAPLADTWNQIPGLAEEAVKKAEEEAARKAAEEEARRAAEEAARRAAEEAARKAEEEEAARKAAQEAASAVRYEEAMTASADDQSLMAAIIYCEAGNQPYDGKVGVGAVILNRVRSGSFPNSVREVIYQRGQFGPAITGKLDRVLAGGNIPSDCYQAAADALAGYNPIGDALFFGNGNYGQLIGDHYFH